MAEHTLTYSDGFKGFPSFYSYIPDYMIGMNNYFYTFKGGDLYRHNVNERRNSFYDVDYSSTMTSVFNDMPLENKLFKTINLESSFADGTHAWGGIFDTDIQTTGFINADWFEKKEGAWFAFMRNEANTPSLSSDYALRSLSGIGACTVVTWDTIAGNPTVIDFALTTDIGSALSIGDELYAKTTLIGTVTAITVDLPGGTNSITVAVTIAGSTATAGNLIVYIKNQTAESFGVLGHYCQFVLTNESTTAVELFAVETEIMKSFP